MLSHPKAFPGQSNFFMKWRKTRCGAGRMGTVAFLIKMLLYEHLHDNTSKHHAFSPTTQEAEKELLGLEPTLGSANEEIWSVVVAELFFISQTCQVPRPQVSFPACRESMYLSSFPGPGLPYFVRSGCTQYY